jgi:hypothetical protein
MTSIPKGFLVFKSFPKPLTDSLLSSPSRETLRSSLSSLLPASFSPLRQEILCDLYSNCLSYCAQCHFSSEKSSCLLDILKHLFETSISERLSEPASFSFFQKLLLKHSVQRSPYSIAVFTAPELKAILDFFLITFFRHYQLYTNAFVPNCNLALKNVNRFEGQFPAVLRLEEGAEINPDTIPALEQFVIKPVIEEPPRELDSSEEEALITDPLQYLLEKEMKQIKSELDERIRKQDDEFLAKIEAFKK